MGTMLLKEAMSVFWQTLRDTWEELYSLGIVNLVWLFSWALPVGLGSATGIPVVVIVTLVLSLCLFAVTTAGVYFVANRVARGRTFHFRDFIEGIQLFWWRALLWLLANALFAFLIYLNLWFWPSNFQGTWVVFVGGFYLAAAVFWLMMQIYFWPILVEQETPKMLLAWRNSAYLIFVNPFFAFFIASFALVLLVLSVALTLPFIFVGIALLALLGNNAVIALYLKFGVIKENPRPGASGP